MKGRIRSGIMILTSLEANRSQFLLNLNKNSQMVAGESSRLTLKTMLSHL
jgi:hypothetical protein